MSNQTTARFARPPLPWLTIAALSVALLCAVPLLAVLANLLAGHSDAWSHLVSTVLPDYALNSVMLTLLVGVAVTLIGVGCAWLTTMCDFPGRGWFDWALILPLAIPAYVMAYAYTDFLQVQGPVQTALRTLMGLEAGQMWFPNIRSLPGAAVMLALVLYPYVYLLARASFLEQSVSAIEVSRSLGHGPHSTFFRVALPLARPAIIAGVSFALMETLADFGTVSYFGVPTFTTGIYRAWFSLGDPVAASQLASLLLLVVGVLIFAERFARGARSTQHMTNRHRPLPSFELHGARAFLATLACAVPLLLGFVLPVLLLSLQALDSETFMSASRFIGIILDSATLAAVTAILAVMLAVLLAWGARREKSALMQHAVAAASLGYAVPGSIIAVGVLVPLSGLDRSLDSFARDAFGISTGLLFTGSIAALVYALLVRFLAVSLQTVDASLGRLPRSTDDAAFVLGHGPWRTLFGVHIPLMTRSLLTAGLVVFVDVLKELPATILMRPFNFTTLAVEAHNLAADERLSEAAPVALVIVAAALLPVILLARRIATARIGDALPPPPA